MVHEENTKLIVSYSLAEIQQVEDELTELLENFREIRREMTRNDLPEVGLKLKTFLLYMRKMREFVPGFISDTKKQSISNSVERARAKYKNLSQKKNR